MFKNLTAFITNLTTRYWPLAWRSTVLATKALLQDALENARRSEDRANRADRQMTNMQMQFGRAMREMHEPWSNYAAKVLYKVKHLRHVQAFMKEPVLSIAPDDYSQHDLMYTREYQLIKLVAYMNLAEDCPPELVADQIADQVRSAVLSQWRHQSLLTTTP